MRFDREYSIDSILRVSSTFCSCSWMEFHTANECRYGESDTKPSSVSCICASYVCSSISVHGLFIGYLLVLYIVTYMVRKYKKTERDVLLVKHILFLEDKSCDDTAHSCNDCREPPFRIRQSADIHAIETENDIRDCHDDGNYRQNFHHDVQIVGNDGSKGIHCSGKDVGVNVTHLYRLMNLNQYIL